MNLLTIINKSILMNKTLFIIEINTINNLVTNYLQSKQDSYNEIEELKNNNDPSFLMVNILF